MEFVQWTEYVLASELRDASRNSGPARGNLVLQVIAARAAGKARPARGGSSLPVSPRLSARLCTTP